jgi:hypothetical protein
VNDELERMWKEAVVAYFKALSWHVPEDSTENHKKPLRIASLQAKI